MLKGKATGLYWVGPVQCYGEEGCTALGPHKIQQDKWNWITQ